MATTFGTSSPSELMSSTIGNTKSFTNNTVLSSPVPAISNTSGGLASMEPNISGPIDSISTESWFGLSTMQLVIIVIILAFLGFNIFRYMDVILNKLVVILSPVFQSFGIDLASITKNIINDTASGTKLGVDIAAGVADNTIDLLSGDAGAAGAAGGGDNESDDDGTDDNDMDGDGKASSSNKKDSSNMLNNAVNRIKNKNAEPTVAPDDSDSMQQGRSVAKNPGFCYIGTDRGIRSCVSVNNKSECDSDDMFKTMEQCVQGGGGPVQSDRLRQLDKVSPHNKEIMSPQKLMDKIQADTSDIYDAV
jgi:hypothetical protein